MVGTAFLPSVDTNTPMADAQKRVPTIAVLNCQTA